MEDVRLFIGNDSRKFRPADVNAYNVFVHKNRDVVVRGGQAPVLR